MSQIDQGELRSFSELTMEVTESVAMTQWPVDELKELCTRVAPIGSRVIMYANRSYLYDDTDPDVPVLTSTIGDLYYEGFFGGFQPVGYVQSLEPGSDIDITIEEPTFRIDTVDDEVRLVPIEAISEMEIDHHDAVSLLEGDELLEDVWVALAGDSVDISAVESLLLGLNHADLRIQIIIDYINDLLPVFSTFVSVTAKRVLFLSKDSFELVDFEDDILADVYDQSCFTCMGLTNTDGTEVSQLCVSVLINEKVAYIPVHGITSLNS